MLLLLINIRGSQLRMNPQSGHYQNGYKIRSKINPILFSALIHNQVYKLCIIQACF